MLPPAGHVALPWSCVSGGPPYVLAPFRSLHPAVVDAVLDALRVGPADMFVDFGCGDGVVLAAAARRCPAVVGVELDPFLVDASRSACPGAIVLHEPIGWTPPTGPTCGLWHQLPWVGDFFAQHVVPYLLPGFRLAVVDADLPGFVPAYSASIRRGEDLFHRLRVYCFPQSSGGLSR